MTTVFRVFAYLRRYPVLAGAQLACAVLMTVMLPVFAQVVKVVTGDVIPSGELARLWPWVTLAAGAFLLTNLFNSLRIVLNNTFEQKVVYDIRSDLYAKIQRLPMRWFDNKRTGDIMTRVSEDVQAVERVLIDGIEQGVVAALQVVIVGGWMIYQSPQLGGVAIIPLPLLVLGAWLYSRSAPERHRRVRRTTSDMNSLLHDNIDGVQQIKIFTRENAELERFNTASDTVRRATLHLMRMWAVYSPSMELLRNTGYVLVVGFGGWWVIEGTVDYEVFVAFLVLLNLFYEPITRLNQLNQIIQAGRAAGERVFEIIDAEEEVDLDQGKMLPHPIRGEVVFEKVGFSYRDDRPTLQNVNIAAQPGQTIALVGHTGAGKSTIINLLARFYEYDEGRITLDGIDIREVRKSSLRQVMGYVTQESFLFNGTVRENLLLAGTEADEDAMWAALEAANAGDFVRALPGRLDTNVGERGVKLSVGEKQRIAISRVILKNPPLLLLDEATSNLDTESERLIQRSLAGLLRGRTSFVIAHRLSTVRRAHRIYVMEGGQVREEGTHEELISRDGIYASLCRSSLIAEDP